MIFMQQIRDYVDHLKILYTHIKSYRATFYAYEIALFSTISSLAAGYVTPKFFTSFPIGHDSEWARQRRELPWDQTPPAIRTGQEAFYYEIQMVLEVSLLSQGIYVIHGITRNTKKPFNVFQATPFYQPNDDGETASIC